MVAACLLIGFGLWWMSSREEGLPETAQTSSPEPDGLTEAGSPRDTPAATPGSQGQVPAATLPVPAAPEPIASPKVVNPMAAPPPVAPPPVTNTAPSGIQPPPAPMVVSPPAVATAPGGSSISQDDIRLDLDKVMISLRDYRTIMKENPIGTNAEIARALNGGNPKQARLLQEGLPMNRDGELVDRWGTPYFFHQLSKDNMEIRSAGPDRMLWTEDDTRSN